VHCASFVSLTELIFICCKLICLCMCLHVALLKHDNTPSVSSFKNIRQTLTEAVTFLDLNYVTMFCTDYGNVWCRLERSSDLVHRNQLSYVFVVLWCGGPGDIENYMHD